MYAVNNVSSLNFFERAFHSINVYIDKKRYNKKVTTIKNPTMFVLCIYILYRKFSQNFIKIM